MNQPVPTSIGSNFPVEARKPEKGIMISLGIGIIALSRVIRKNIPRYPTLEMKEVMNSINGLAISKTIDN